MKRAIDVFTFTFFLNSILLNAFHARVVLQCVCRYMKFLAAVPLHIGISYVLFSSWLNTKLNWTRPAHKGPKFSGSVVLRAKQTSTKFLCKHVRGSSEVCCSTGRLLHAEEATKLTLSLCWICCEGSGVGAVKDLDAKLRRCQQKRQRGGRGWDWWSILSFHFSLDFAHFVL